MILSSADYKEKIIKIKLYFVVEIWSPNVQVQFVYFCTKWHKGTKINNLPQTWGKAKLILVWQHTYRNPHMGRRAPATAGPDPLCWLLSLPGSTVPPGWRWQRKTCDWARPHSGSHLKLPPRGAPAGQTEGKRVLYSTRWNCLSDRTASRDAPVTADTVFSSEIRVGTRTKIPILLE